MDSLACFSAGLGLPHFSQSASAARLCFPGTGTGSLSPFAAAYLYGQAANALDYDDTLDGHPGSPIIGAMLAIGADKGLSVDRLLRGIAAGYRFIRSYRRLRPHRTSGQRRFAPSVSLTRSRRALAPWLPLGRMRALSGAPLGSPCRIRSALCWQVVRTARPRDEEQYGLDRGGRGLVSKSRHRGPDRDHPRTGGRDRHVADGGLGRTVGRWTNIFRANLPCSAPASSTILHAGITQEHLRVLAKLLDRSMRKTRSARSWWPSPRTWKSSATKP